MYTKIIPIKRLLLIEKEGYYDKEIYDFFLEYAENSATGMNHPDNIYGCSLIRIEGDDYRVYLGRDCRLTGESSARDYDRFDGCTYEMVFSLDYFDSNLVYAVNNAKNLNMYYFSVKENEKEYIPSIECTSRKVLKVEINTKNEHTDLDVHQFGITFNQKVIGKSVSELRVLVID